MALGTETKKVIIEVLMNDKASKEMNNLKLNSANSSKSIVSNFTAIATKAVVVAGAVTAVGAAVYKVAERTGQIQKLSKDFDTLSSSIGTNAASAMEKLEKATRGTVSQFDLMGIGNKIMLQGLAKNEDQMARIVEIADRLGSQTLTTTGRVEEFTQLLRNQSILMLDNFGISSGIVRDRIEELQEEFPGMTRDVAFMTATLEQAESKMSLLGATTETSYDSWIRLGKTLTDIKDNILMKLSTVADALTSALLWLWEALQKLWQDAQQYLIPVWEYLLELWNDELKPAVVELGNTYMKMLNEMGISSEDLKNIVKLLAFGIGATLLGAVVAITKALTIMAKIMTDVYDKASKLIRTIKQLAGVEGYGLAGGSGGGSFATGGYVPRGKYYVAGENGPELIRSQGDHVYNGNESSKMGGGDLVINVNAPVYGVDNLKASIISAVKEAQSRENSLSKYNLAI